MSLHLRLRFTLASSLRNLVQPTDFACAPSESLAAWSNTTMSVALGYWTGIILYFQLNFHLLLAITYSFSALTLLIGWRKGHPACKNFRTSNPRRLFLKRRSWSETLPFILLCLHSLPGDVAREREREREWRISMTSSNFTQGSVRTHVRWSG